MKACPYCAEPIRADARICPYCRKRQRALWQENGIALGIISVVLVGLVWLGLLSESDGGALVALVGLSLVGVLIWQRRQPR